MRESPSCVVTVRHFGGWRAALVMVALAALAALAAWATAALQSQPARTAFVLAGSAAVLGLGAIPLAVSLARVPSGVLACAGGRWAFMPDRPADQQPESGALAVAIDLGSFLLLTLTAPSSRGRLSRRWLPVLRRSLEGDWHALRCAVYSPPPVVPGAPGRRRTPSLNERS